MPRSLPPSARLAAIVLIGLVTLAPRAWAADDDDVRDLPQVLTVAARANSDVPPHRFLDNTNALLSGLEAAGLIGDAVSTRRGLDRYPGMTREADPLARPFVALGWPGQILGGGLFVTAELFGRRALHRSGHHRFERLLPVALAALEFGVTAHNVRSLRRLDRLVATGR